MWIPVGNGSYFAGYMGMGIVFQKGHPNGIGDLGHIPLSGCPAVTLSEVKKVVICRFSIFLRTAAAPQLGGGGGSSSLRKPRIYRIGDPPFPGIAGLWNERLAFTISQQLFRILQHGAGTQMVIVKGLAHRDRP